ncbi:ionotropic receptor 21a-like [Panulirus ornatus]|uniref:ionotropic receptor 21a-like n=1 Tax=Panulirus ornatus TaxID=150431 RepID=UPI003A8942AD
MIQELFGSFTGQTLSKWLPSDSPSRILMAVWLVFAFIFGTVYRGNLTAALTLPKYPPRPETVEELVDHVNRVTMPPFGKEWQENFRQSGLRTYERLADLMYVGPSYLEGLKQVTEKQGQMIARLVFGYWTAEYLTRPDGTIGLYFGREIIDPGASGWPIPHDAPYKPNLDNIMMAVNEAGLHDKWTEDTLEETRRIGRARTRRRQLEQAEEGGEVAQPDATGIKALTIVHMQGPLMLLLLGLIIGGLSFITETITASYTQKHRA